MKNIPILIAACAVLFAIQPKLAAQDHSHVNAGASGGTLIIDNYEDFIDFDIVLTYVPLDYVYPGTGTDLTKYKGYFQGNITFTVLAASAVNGGPEPNAPALGSYIQLQLVSVEGPDGGTFSFWNTGAMAPTYSMLADTSGGTSMWNLSGGSGAPGSDPFGHVHGRRFTVDTPGTYTVGFQLVDTSTNGPGGGPIYSEPSQVYYFTYTAVPEPSAAGLMMLGVAWLAAKRRKTVRGNIGPVLNS